MARLDYLESLIADVCIDSRCPERLKLSFERLLEGLSASSSLTSRRYPVWPLVRQHMDSAFSEAMAAFQGEWCRELLADFQLSRMGDSSPLTRAMPRGCKGWEIEALDSPTEKPAAMPPVDWQLNNIERWDCNFRYSLLSVSDSSDDAESFRGVLEVGRELIRLLRNFRPGRTAALQDYDSQKDERTRPQSGGYCELCWRLSVRASRLRSLVCYQEGDERNIQERIRAGRLSDRYCSFHLPGSKGYHADLRYKFAFNRQLEVLTGSARSEYAFNLRPPASASMEEIRKTAYEQVHAKLHPVEVRGAKSLGLREKIWLMHKEGVSQSEMARRLGISRQAVSKAKKRLEWLINAHHSGCYLSDFTGEAVLKPELSNRVEELLRKGLPLADIAREVGLTKSTLAGLARLRGELHSTD